MPTKKPVKPVQEKPTLGIAKVPFRDAKNSMVMTQTFCKGVVSEDDGREFDYDFDVDIAARGILIRFLKRGVKYDKHVCVAINTSDFVLQVYRELKKKGVSFD
jgi:hypothetical protein